MDATFWIFALGVIAVGLALGGVVVAAKREAFP